MSWNQVAYKSTDATATGPHMRLSHGANFPFAVGLLLSTICPMVISVTASTNLAPIIIIPTIAAETPIISV